MESVNIGPQKNFQITELSQYRQVVGSFSNLGDFFYGRWAAARAGQRPALLPITWFKYNPAFGQLIQSFDREEVSASGEIRLRARIVRLGVARNRIMIRFWLIVNSANYAVVYFRFKQ